MKLCSKRKKQAGHGPLEWILTIGLIVGIVVAVTHVWKGKRSEQQRPAVVYYAAPAANNHYAAPVQQGWSKRQWRQAFAAGYIVIASGIILFLGWFALYMRKKNKEAIRNYMTKLDAERNASFHARRTQAHASPANVRAHYVGTPGVPRISASDSVTQKLTQLKILRNGNLISPAEYEQKKNEVLKKL